MDIEIAFRLMIQAICLTLGVQVVSRTKFSTKFNLLLMLALSITLVPIFYYFKFFSVPYLMIVFLTVLYSKSKNIKMSIISVAVVFAGFITLDSLAYLSGGLLGSMTSTKIGGYSFITSFIFLVYAFIILKIIDLILGKVRDDVIFQGKYLLVAVILSSFTVGLFYIYIIQGSEGGAGFTDEKLRANAIIFFVYTIILGIALTIIVKTAVKSAKLEAQALQMRQLQEYVGALEALQKDVRVFRHDYVNILSGINGFITNEDMDGLRVYFRTKVIPMNSDMEVNISKLATLHNLEVVELKGLFATKLIRAQELGVNAQVEVYKKIDQINMDSIDLCRAVGILLDNAIEAVMGTEDPTIRVAIIQKKDAIVLVFANNLPEDSPPVHQFFDEGFSTKGENRGLGLSTLKKTLKKYPNVSLDTKVTQLGFVQELEIG